MIVDACSSTPLSSVRLLKQNLELNHQVKKLACSTTHNVLKWVKVIERIKDDPLLFPAVPKIVSVYERKLWLEKKYFLMFLMKSTNLESCDVSNTWWPIGVGFKRYFQKFMLLSVQKLIMTSQLFMLMECIAWKVSKYGVFSGPNTAYHKKLRIWTRFTQ